MDGLHSVPEHMAFGSGGLQQLARRPMVFLQVVSCKVMAWSIGFAGESRSTATRLTKLDSDVLGNDREPTLDNKEGR